ncbi:MAG TPA: RNA methyltransferase [Chitinophagaceae bacterium]|nr:RNA methyltransferase [Chitinophagaceae bacterium]
MRKLQGIALKRKTVPEFRSADKTPLVLVLDNIRSMHNVGAVFRIADAFLLRGIFLCGFTPRPPHRDIHKTALGATETVPWQYYPKTIGAVRFLQESGYHLWAAEQATDSLRLDQFRPGEALPLGIIFGNELSGVDPEVLELVEGCLEIPQAGMKHSLNVSVSAGIIAWDLFRRIGLEQPEALVHIPQP